MTKIALDLSLELKSKISDYLDLETSSQYLLCVLSTQTVVDEGQINTGKESASMRCQDILIPNGSMHAKIGVIIILCQLCVPNWLENWIGGWLDLIATKISVNWLELLHYTKVLPHLYKWSSQVKSSQVIFISSSYWTHYRIQIFSAPYHIKATLKDH